MNSQKQKYGQIALKMSKVWWKKLSLSCLRTNVQNISNSRLWFQMKKLGVQIHSCIYCLRTKVILTFIQTLLDVKFLDALNNAMLTVFDLELFHKVFLSWHNEKLQKESLTSKNMFSDLQMESNMIIVTLKNGCKLKFELLERDNDRDSQSDNNVSRSYGDLMNSALAIALAMKQRNSHKAYLKTRDLSLSSQYDWIRLIL